MAEPVTFKSLKERLLEASPTKQGQDFVPWLESLEQRVWELRDWLASSTVSQKELSMANTVIDRLMGLLGGR